MVFPFKASSFFFKASFPKSETSLPSSSESFFPFRNQKPSFFFDGTKLGKKSELHTISGKNRSLAAKNRSLVHKTCTIAPFCTLSKICASAFAKGGYQNRGDWKKNEYKPYFSNTQIQKVCILSRTFAPQ